MDGDSGDAGEDELTCVRSAESDKSLWSEYQTNWTLHKLYK